MRVRISAEVSNVKKRTAERMIASIQPSAEQSETLFHHCYEPPRERHAIEKVSTPAAVTPKATTRA
jgi:hypothetical protein